MTEFTSWVAFKASIKANGEDALIAYLAALESAREQGYDSVHRSEPKPPFAVAETALPGEIVGYDDMVTRIGWQGSPINLVCIRWRDNGGEFKGVMAADLFEAADKDMRVVLDVEGGLRGDGQIGMWVRSIQATQQKSLSQSG